MPTLLITNTSWIFIRSQVIYFEPLAKQITKWFSHVWRKVWSDLEISFSLSPILYVNKVICASKLLPNWSISHAHPHNIWHTHQNLIEKWGKFYVDLQTNMRCRKFSNIPWITKTLVLPSHYVNVSISNFISFVTIWSQQ